jgi:hypothetical protein
VKLKQVGDTTRLQWEAHSQVTGRLAQLGSRLIAASADKLTQDFFKKFAQQFAPSQSVETRFAWWKSVIQLLKRLFQT